MVSKRELERKNDCKKLEYRLPVKESSILIQILAGIS